jgi:hypothetical protein
MRSYKNAERLLSMIYVVSLVLLIGIVFLLHGAILVDLVGFFSTLTLVQVPGTGIYLPAPSNPRGFVDLYTAAFQFCLGLGILEAVVFVLRPLFGSPLQRRAETLENIVFWFGASYLVVTYLNAFATVNSWFVFWTGMVVIFALALLARWFVLLIKKQDKAASSS